MKSYKQDMNYHYMKAYNSLLGIALFTYRFSTCLLLFLSSVNLASPHCVLFGVIFVCQMEPNPDILLSPFFYGKQLFALTNVEDLW